MTIEAEKATRIMNNTKDLDERAHIKEDIDMMPLSSGELDQVQQREEDRITDDIREFKAKKAKK